MQYYININQLALNAYDDLDLIDGALLSFLHIWSLSTRSQKLSYNDKVFVWVNPDMVIKQLPKIGIKSRQGIFKRFEKILKHGLVERHPDNKKMNRTYLALGDEYDKFIHVKGVNESLQGVNHGLQGCQPPFTPRVNHGLHNNKNKDNKNKDNKRERAYKSKFEIFRQKYPATKRGLNVEFKNFTKKFNSEIIDKLLPALENQIAAKIELERQGKFCAEWPHLQTWINGERWTLEIPTESQQKPKRITYA